MMKKFHRDTLKPDPILACNTNKNLNVRQSDRKRNLFTEDNFNNIDVHLLFIQNINVKKV